MLYFKTYVPEPNVRRFYQKVLLKGFFKGRNVNCETRKVHRERRKALNQY